MTFWYQSEHARFCDARLLPLLAMAAKRQRTTGLGGGTGDIKPQYFTLVSGPMASDEYDVVQFSLPVNRLGTTKTKATVFEILSLDWFLGIDSLLDGSHVTWAFLTTSTRRVDQDGALQGTLSQDLESPQSIGPAVRVNVSNAPASGAFSYQVPIHVDTTDGAGNGVLVATDSIFVVSGNVGNGITSKTIVKVKYRLTDVGITEYVGIVQSQQI